MKTTYKSYTIVILKTLLAVISLDMVSSAFCADTKLPDVSTAANAIVIHQGNTTVMTDDYFKVILDDVAANGTTAALRTGVSDLLGLTRNGEILKARKDAFEDGSGDTHSIASLDHDKGYVISYAKQQVAYYYRLDRSRGLVAAVLSSPKGVVRAIPNVDAQKQLDAEWLFWVDTALRLQASK